MTLFRGRWLWHQASHPCLTSAQVRPYHIIFFGRGEFLTTRIMIYKSNWFLFNTRFKGGFFQYPVLVTLRSPLRPDQSSTRHSYGALRVGWTSTRQCLFFDNFSAFWSMFLAKTASLTKNLADMGQIMANFDYVRLKFDSPIYWVLGMLLGCP